MFCLSSPSLNRENPCVCLYSQLSTSLSCPTNICGMSCSLAHHLFPYSNFKASSNQIKERECCSSSNTEIQSTLIQHLRPSSCPVDLFRNFGNVRKISHKFTKRQTRKCFNLINQLRNHSLKHGVCKNYVLPNENEWERITHNFSFAECEISSFNDKCHFGTNKRGQTPLNKSYKIAPGQRILPPFAHLQYCQLKNRNVSRYVCNSCENCDIYCQHKMFWSNDSISNCFSEAQAPSSNRFDILSQSYDNNNTYLRNCHPDRLENYHFHQSGNSKFHRKRIQPNNFDSQKSGFLMNGMRAYGESSQRCHRCCLNKHLHYSGYPITNYRSTEKCCHRPSNGCSIHCRDCKHCHCFACNRYDAQLQNHNRFCHKCDQHHEMCHHCHFCRHNTEGKSCCLFRRHHENHCQSLDELMNCCGSHTARAVGHVDTLGNLGQLINACACNFSRKQYPSKHINECYMYAWPCSSTTREAGTQTRSEMPKKRTANTQTCSHPKKTFVVSKVMRRPRCSRQPYRNRTRLIYFVCRRKYFLKKQALKQKHNLFESENSNWPATLVTNCQTDEEILKINPLRLNAYFKNAISECRAALLQGALPCENKFTNLQNFSSKVTNSFHNFVAQNSDRMEKLNNHQDKANNICSYLQGIDKGDYPINRDIIHKEMHQNQHPFLLYGRRETCERQKPLQIESGKFSSFDYPIIPEIFYRSPKSQVCTSYPLENHKTFLLGHSRNSSTHPCYDVYKSEIGHNNSSSAHEECEASGNHKLQSESSGRPFHQFVLSSVEEVPPLSQH